MDGVLYMKLLKATKTAFTELFKEHLHDIFSCETTEKYVTQVTEIKTLKGEELELANTNDDLWVKFANPPKEYQYALVRTVGIKGVTSEAQSCACS